MLLSLRSFESPAVLMPSRDDIVESQRRNDSQSIAKSKITQSPKRAASPVQRRSPEHGESSPKRDISKALMRVSGAGGSRKSKCTKSSILAGDALGTSIPSDLALLYYEDSPAAPQL